MGYKPIHELRGAIPKAESFSTSAFRKGEQILGRLYSIITDPKKSHQLYVLLEKLLEKRDPAYKTPYEIEVYPGLKLPVYTYIVHKKRNGRTSPLGLFGSRKEKLFGLPKARITLALWGDPENQEMIWSDHYEETLTHEITHVFQALDVALRVMHQKNMKITPDALLPMLSRVGSRGGSSTKLKDIEKSNVVGKLDKEIAYHKVPAELGANANALLNFIAKKYGRDAIEDIVGCVDRGSPTFKDIDNAIRDADRTGRTVWGTYEKISDAEMQYKNISRIEWTDGYQLKKLLLKTASEFYKRHYK